MNQLKPGITRCENLETDQTGTVCDVLAAQCTIDYDDGTFGFLLYRYYNVTWRIIE